MVLNVLMRPLAVIRDLAIVRNNVNVILALMELIVH